jgi:cyclic pyranopterin phosphate synthase
MNTRLMLRKLFEPVYRHSPTLKSGLRAVDAQLNSVRTVAWHKLPSLIRPEPREIFLTLTANCNLRCKGCRYGRDFMPGAQLPLELVREVLEDCKACDFELIRLYGGEPLMHKEIAQIVEHCARLRLSTFLTTNGILLKNKIDDLYAAGLRRVSVGFYGVGADYDAYVQRKDRFAQLEESIAYVRSRYGERISLQLNWLMMRPTCNLDSVRRTWEFAERYRMPIFINLIHYSLPYFSEGQDGELQFSAGDRPAIEAVVAELLRLRERRPELLPMSPTVIRSIPDWLVKGPAMRVPCDRHRLIWVGADGTVQMCYVQFKLGNLHEKRLKDMLFTPAHHQAARDAFALNCKNCHCGFDTRTLADPATRRRYALS